MVYPFIVKSKINNVKGKRIFSNEVCKNYSSFLKLNWMSKRLVIQ